jgi:metal-responsive CopG/Arc/MetJ family transcriptional regulator
MIEYEMKNIGTRIPHKMYEDIKKIIKEKSYTLSCFIRACIRERIVREQKADKS